MHDATNTARLMKDSKAVCCYAARNAQRQLQVVINTQADTAGPWGTSGYFIVQGTMIECTALISKHTGTEASPCLA